NKLQLILSVITRFLVLKINDFFLIVTCSMSVVKELQHPLLLPNRRSDILINLMNQCDESGIVIYLLGWVQLNDYLLMRE
ncbi:MAG: hypothetical protein KAH18_08050, partial [Psychromonas sp.]|nr:hypothetical protein [Psychromonas sp.]